MVRVGAPASLLAVAVTVLALDVANAAPTRVLAMLGIMAQGLGLEGVLLLLRLLGLEPFGGVTRGRADVAHAATARVGSAMASVVGSSGLALFLILSRTTARGRADCLEREGQKSIVSKRISLAYIAGNPSGHPHCPHLHVQSMRRALGHAPGLTVQKSFSYKQVCPR